MKQPARCSPRIVRRFSLMYGTVVLLLSLTACQDAVQISQNENDSAYTSAEFSPTNHQKNHTVSAFVVAVEQARLAFQVSGRLSFQHVEIGQQVEKEDALMTLYNPELAPQIDRIKGQIAANQADLDQIRAELERNQSLSAIQAISQNELDRLSSRAEQLQSQQSALNAQLKAATNTLNETTLSAPFSGEVADILVKPGTLVEAGQPVIELSGSQWFEAPLYVSRELLDHLQLKQELIAHSGAKTFHVIVKEISRSANPVSQLYKVVVSLPNQTAVLTGQKIVVTIPETRSEVFALPVSAVIDDGINEPYVYVLQSDQLKHRPVEVIEFNRNTIWVFMDNPAGQPVTVVTAGQSSLTPPNQSDQP